MKDINKIEMSTYLAVLAVRILNGKFTGWLLSPSLIHGRNSQVTVAFIKAHQEFDEGLPILMPHFVRMSKL